MGEAQLLSYYVGAGPKRHGHTVLCVKKDRDVEVYDPADQHATRVQADFGEPKAMDLLQRLLLAELAGRIVKAVTIALLNESLSPPQA